MSGAWNSWYHCTGNTHGTWLRGSDLRYRERHHRLHVEGDYRNPPPPGKYAHVKRLSLRLMTQAPVYLDQNARQLAVGLFVDSFEKDRIDVVCVAIDEHHFHCLVRVSDHRPRHRVGRAMGRSARGLIDEGLCSPGKVWGVRCACKPVRDRAHQLAIVRYILAHGEKGAEVWRVPKEKPSR